MLKVTIPVHLRNKASFNVQFDVKSVRQEEQWRLLRPGLIVDNVVTIPSTLADHTSAVPDKLAYVWKSGKLMKVTNDRPIRRGGILLVCESPHRHEFDRSGNPIAPLLNPRTRAKVDTHPGRLIKEAIEKAEIILDDVDLVLGNPIQFQCSLHSLMENDEQTLVTDVRNAVWRNLFKKKVDDSYPVKEDFRKRVQRIAPTLLLLAPTQVVRVHVRRAATELAPHVAEIHAHPSVWIGDTCIANT